MDTKKCNRCEQIKPFSEFYAAKDKSDGRKTLCKLCSTTHRPTERLNNSDIVAGKRVGNLTAIMLSDQRSGSREIQWLFHCDCGKEAIIPVRDVARGHRVSCGCRRGGSDYKIRKDATLNAVCQEYKKNARTRKYSWELSRDHVRELIEGNCFYCGAVPSITVTSKAGNTMVRNGIDRLDSSVGYVLENCVSCCSRCNYLKGNLSHIEFKQAIKDIYTHFVCGETEPNA